MNATLSPQQQDALLTVALMAAFADDRNDEVERSELKRIASTLPLIEASTAYQRVLLKQTTLADAAAGLNSPELRRLAYEMAVCVCDADNALNEREKAFLEQLRRELGLEEQAAAAFRSEADAIAQGALAAPPVIPVTAAATAAGGATALDAEIDRMVLNYAILNGALELLPESISTMAIVPLQMKMVYRVGKRYGFELDRGHIMELLGAAGVGLTSQVVEGFARKMLGGLLGKVGGGLGRSVGNQMASSAMSFASTYALGQLAQMYYAGGRKLSTVQLKDTFRSLTDRARSLHGRYAGEIQDRARSINPAEILRLARA